MCVQQLYIGQKVINVNGLLSEVGHNHTHIFRCAQQLDVGQKMINVNGLLSGVGHGHAQVYLPVIMTVKCMGENDHCQ